MIKYPEHTKLEALQGRNNEIGAFIEWLGSKGVTLAKTHIHSEECGEVTADFDNAYRRKSGEHCGYYEDELIPSGKTIEDWIAEYFVIDPEKLEAEKRQMLDEIRKGK